MELFFFRPAEYERLYNCTGLIIDSVPLEQRQFVPESIVICILCTIYYVLYLPCIYSIWKHMRENSCYKMLFYIGITDLVNMFVLGYFTAWLSFRGAVFCSNPTLIYFAGMTASTIYIAESTMDLVLAFNRCLELSSARASHFLFSGRRINYWIIGCSLYALYWAVFIKPPVFSGLFFAWFYNPFIGYHKAEYEYEEPIQIVHDIGVAFLCPIIYFILAAKLFFDIRKNRQQFGTYISELDTLRAKAGSGSWSIHLEPVMGRAHLPAEDPQPRPRPCRWSTQAKLAGTSGFFVQFDELYKMTFVQVFLISLIHSLTGIFYVYLQYNEAHQWMITLAEFAWFHVHGFPPVIYWALNKTMREDCRMLYMKMFHSNRVSVISGVTVLRSRHTQQH
ncbi:hypothetical protein niasHT_032187 [Heterodera trifolii]|uniref:G protein-coupled receptor n=1 Tax=Heterodera trifolii TaxID=157864 RepID=A0ABD2HY05_9BILA